MDKTELIEYLNQSTIPEGIRNPINVEMLAGGLANFVWKVQTRNGYVIVKNYANYLKHDPSISISASRSFTEWNALVTVYNSPGSKLWALPKPLFYDDQKHVIIMEFINASDLFHHLLADSPSISMHLPWINKAIATFIADVKKIKVDNELFMNTPVAQFYENEISRIDSVFERLKCSKKKKKEMAERVRSNLSDRGNFIFGDLWPQSILIDIQNERIFVIDWECARMGSSDQDNVQLVANLFLMTIGQPFNHENCSNLFKLVSELPLNKAKLVYMILTLMDYPHWKLPDKEIVLKECLKLL